jgi:hypothetical protein
LKKRLLSLLISLTLAFTVLPVTSASAATVTSVTATGSGTGNLAPSGFLVPKGAQWQTGNARCLEFKDRNQHSDCHALARHILY